MAWTWPGRRFDIVTKSAEYVNCAYLSHNDAVVTVERDYRAPFGRTVRLRTQVSVETIESVHEHAVSAEVDIPPVTAGSAKGIDLAR